MENFLTSSRNRFFILICLVGLILIGIGVFFFKTGSGFIGTKVEVLPARNASQSDAGGSGELTVEISGEVIKPGVYKLQDGARIEDLLVMSGGFSSGADRNWTEKYLNRAAKITDGQKIYIPSFDSAQDSHSGVLSAKTSGGDQSVSSTFSSDSKPLLNINSSSLSQLDSLPGIGQVYGQNIIDHRPYSSVAELLSKGVLKKSVYEKIKDLVSVY